MIEAPTIKSLIHDLNPDSYAEHHLESSPDAFIFLDECKNKSQILCALEQLPLAADSGFITKHFYLKKSNSPAEDIFVFKALKNKNRLVCFLESEEALSSIEKHFLISTVEPQLIHFCNSIRFIKDHCFFDESKKNVLHVGVQKHATDRNAEEFLNKSGQQFIKLEQIHKRGLLSSIESQLPRRNHNNLWIRISMNAFSHGQGGDTDSWPIGIDYSTFLDCLSWLNSQNNLMGISLTPNPNLESASRAGAQILSNYLHNEGYRRVINQFHGKLK